MTEGRQLGKYKIVEELGSGGFATVFRAIDTTLDREVALKILHPPLLADRRFVRNFREEAKTLAALRHPQIITIYEVGEVDGRIFIAMDLARGANLAKSIADRGRIPWKETLALLKPICEALDYAHEQGVVHRDLKPANILIGKRRGALLTDFGFAKLLAENPASMTMSGGIVGTPGYIAPEVWEDNAANAPADIYALGCIVYEMLTGDALFKGQTPMQAMRAHDRGPKFPEAWPDDVPAGLTPVIAKALARDPADRYPTAGALWHALDDLETQPQAGRTATERAEIDRHEAERRAEEDRRAAEQRAAIAAQWRAETEKALAENNLAAAKMALGRWRAVAPDDPAIEEALAKLEQPSDQSLADKKPSPVSAWVRRAGWARLISAVLGLVVVVSLVTLLIRNNVPSGSAGAAPLTTTSPGTSSALQPSATRQINPTAPKPSVSVDTPTPADTPTLTPPPTPADTPTLTSPPTPADTPTLTPPPTPADTPTLTRSPTFTPVPLVNFSVRPDVSFDGTGNSGQFSSCLAGRVLHRDGSPFSKVIVDVSNGPEIHYAQSTGNDGIYRICGLGASRWGAVVVQVPGRTLVRPLPQGIVYVNGGSQEAIINFQEK